MPQEAIMTVKELNVNDLVGMDLQPAKSLIFKKGWRFLVIKEDGVTFTKHDLTEKRKDRILLSVLSKIVVDAVVG
jgi:hypothetical protein